ncbi:hypothetical protein E0K93_09440 [Puniceibacterium sp. HSS470]|nr:hypothetical protein E0K93_09440 [Puniceibacterium sp. HSS470]|tara:strand:- start:23630 stop:24238 length:609 start_codon:yes stop_codon:yes gene_type:complete
MPVKAGRRAADATTPGRQEIWQAIRSLGSRFSATDQGFTVADIGQMSRANDKSIRDYLKCLIAGGYLAERSGCEVMTVDLVNDAGHHAPRLRTDGSPVTQGAGIENMWRSMYMLREFTHEDIAAHATTSTVTVSRDTAKTYIYMLMRCGYLKVLRKAKPMKGQMAQYRLVRNNGPKPPQIQRVKRIYDPNSMEVFEPQKVSA